MQPVLLGALRHLRSTSPLPDCRRPPELTIGLWDSAASGIPLPPMPWPGSAIRIRGDVELPCGAGPEAGENLRACYRPGTAELSLMKASGELGIYNTRDAASLPHDSRGSPLIALLGWHAARLDLQLVHAAAVGNAERAVLLVGPGGSGKSTSALACLVRGMSYLGDDYVLVRVGPRPHVFNLYGSAKLETRRASDFPELAALASQVLAPTAPDSPGPGKVVFYVPDGDASLLARERPLAAILIPHVTGSAGSSIRPAKDAEAFSALAPSTVFQLAGSGASHVRALARLTRMVPCFHLDLGTDLDSIPPVIQDVLSHGER